MKVHILQHVPFEGLGSIDLWLAERKAQVTFTRFFESAALPAPADFDLVIALGGPMSVNDGARFPWLGDEKRFIARAVRAATPVLGICLGAQLIASALGARVYAGPRKEIGWFPIEATSAPWADIFAFPPAVTVFHWHGETFDLPAGAIRLARSAGCENQAFQMGPNTIGLQFHLETTPASAAAIVAQCRHELVEGPFVQSEAALRGVPVAAYGTINRLMADVLAYLTRGMG